jgi:hypothetical protein
MLGVATLTLLVHKVGPEALRAMLTRTLGYLPLLLVLEAMRIACDTTSTQFLYARAGRKPPFRELLRTHLLAYPVNTLMPAGRAAAEALKAQELAPYVGAPAAVAVATMNQTAALMSGGVASIPSIVAARAAPGTASLIIALIVQALVSFGGGVFVQLVARRRAIGSWMAKRWSRAGRIAIEYQSALFAHAVVPIPSILAMLGLRACQVAQYAILLRAAGVAPTVSSALMAYGIGIVGSSVGDLIPGQVGATDGAFALGAPLLGLNTADAVGMAIAVHFVQLLWAIFGALSSFVWKPGPSREPIAVIPPKE